MLASKVSKHTTCDRMNDLNLAEMIHAAQRAGESTWGAEECRIATTANDTDDTVYVTLPNSEAPQQRVEVSYWSLQVSWNGASLSPRWPTRGDTGLAIFMDTGEVWLIY